MPEFLCRMVDSWSSLTVSSLSASDAAEQFVRAFLPELVHGTCGVSSVEVRDDFGRSFWRVTDQNKDGVRVVHAVMYRTSSR